METKTLSEKIKTVHKYWQRRVDKCCLKEKSLERQLEGLDAYTADWEECYQMLVNVQDERDAMFLSVMKAHQCYCELGSSYSTEQTLEKELRQKGLLGWLEENYQKITVV